MLSVHCTEGLSIFLYCLSVLPAGKGKNEPLVMFGDIAVETDVRNADRCVLRGCLWPKASDGNVYVPYRIAQEYCESLTSVPSRLDNCSLLSAKLYDTPF